MATFRMIPAVLLPLSLIACGDGSGAGAGITVRATSSALAAGASTGAALVFQDDAGRTYTATQALMRVKDIELKLPRGMRCSEIADELAGGARCDHRGDDDSRDDDSRDDDSRDDDSHDDDDDEIKIRGPFIVDLLTGTSTPSLDDVRIPAVTYREIEFELSDARGDGDLDDHSFALRATFDDGGTPAELVLRLDGDDDIEIERPEGVTVAPGSSLLILLDASVWLQGVPLQACIDDKGLEVVNGVLTIEDDTGCDDLEDAFGDRLEASCSFDDDHDDDDDDDDRDDDDGFDDNGGDDDRFDD